MTPTNFILRKKSKISSSVLIRGDPLRKVSSLGFAPVRGGINKAWLDLQRGGRA